MKKRTWLIPFHNPYLFTQKASARELITKGLNFIQLTCACNQWSGNGGMIFMIQADSVGRYFSERK